VKTNLLRLLRSHASCQPWIGAVAILITTNASLKAQTIPSGDRVRATIEMNVLVVRGAGIDTTVQTSRITGTLTQLGPDTLRILPDGAQPDAPSTALVIHSVTRLEVSEGRKSNVGKGALIGGGVGLALGGGFALLAASKVDTEVSTGEVLAFTGITAAVGAGIGALIGSLGGSERWTEYPMGHLRISLAPIAGRVGVLATLRTR
jgi:hypothetical protein